MKIREGFVTNSSSYSSVVFTVENPVLGKILAEYSDIRVIKRLLSGDDECPTLSYKEGEQAVSLYVCRISGVTDAVLELLGDHWWTTPEEDVRMEELRERIKAHREELAGSYQRVYFEREDLDGGSFETLERTVDGFDYDIKHDGSGDGRHWHYQDGEEDEEWDDDEEDE